MGVASQSIRGQNKRMIAVATGLVLHSLKTTVAFGQVKGGWLCTPESLNSTQWHRFFVKTNIIALACQNGLLRNTMSTRFLGNWGVTIYGD
jgi:hypothetical protein